MKIEKRSRLLLVMMLMLVASLLSQSAKAIDYTALFGFRDSF